MVCDSDQLYQQYLAVWSVQKTKDLGLQKDAFEWKYSAENLRQTKIKEKYYEKCVKKVVTKSCLFVIYVFAFVMLAFLLLSLFFGLIKPLNYDFLVYIIVPCLIPLVCLEIGYFTEVEYPPFIAIAVIGLMISFSLIGYLLASVWDKVLQSDYFWINIVVILCAVLIISTFFMCLKNYKVYRECKHLRNDCEVLITFHIDNLLTTNDMIISYMVLYNTFHESIITFLQRANEFSKNHVHYYSPRLGTSPKTLVDYYTVEINENIKCVNQLLKSNKFDLFYCKPICLYLNKYHQIEESYYFIEMNHNERNQGNEISMNMDICNPFSDSTKIKDPSTISIDVDINNDLNKGRINLNNNASSEPQTSLSSTPRQPLYMNDKKTEIIRYSESSTSSSHFSHDAVFPVDALDSSEASEKRAPSASLPVLLEDPDAMLLNL